MYNFVDFLARERSGLALEEAYYKAIRSLTKDVVDTTGTVIDHNQGTDFIVDGIRIDLTSNIGQKDHMIILPKEYPMRTRTETVVRFHFAIRTGNSRHMFERPVLVIGFDMSGTELEALGEEFDDALQTNIDEIMQIAYDAYYDFDDQNPGFLY